MNCFVIMPFASEFEDVYSAIKQSASAAAKDVNCFRLDDACPAGRITNHLLDMLNSATFCIADLTGCNPNVMWEVGYAMALGKPTIIITQSLPNLPFDIKDMRAVEYDRSRISGTLSERLRRMIIDTLAMNDFNNTTPKANRDNSEVIGTLLNEMSQLKEMVFEAVNARRDGDSICKQPLGTELVGLCGHWLNSETGTHIYARIVGGELIAPYCYGGNDEISGVYFDWRRTGDYWFARFTWLKAPITGFTFLRQDSVDILSGAWWSAELEEQNVAAPPRSTGIAAHWARRFEKDTPEWVEAFFQKVEREGIVCCLPETI